MSASSLTSALVTMLSAGSAFGSDAVGEDYSVLESASGIAAVVSWSGIKSSPMAKQSWGRSKRSNTWTFTLEMFSKDTGDPAKLVADRKRMIDTTLSVLGADETIQGLASFVGDINGDRTPGEGRVWGGVLWHPSTVTVDIGEYQEA